MPVEAAVSARYRQDLIDAGMAIKTEASGRFT